METKRIGAKELRRNLKKYVEGIEIVEIGSFWDLRAFLVPVQGGRTWDSKLFAKAVRAAVKKFLAAAKTATRRR